MLHYIYVLTDPRTGQVRYCGRSKDPTTRWRAHCNEVGGCPRNRWIDELRSTKLRPTIHIVDCLEVNSPEEMKTLSKRETLWIKHLAKLGCDLTNYHSYWHKRHLNNRSQQ